MWGFRLARSALTALSILFSILPRLPVKCRAYSSPTPPIGVQIRFPAAFADHAGSTMKGSAYVADAYRLDDAETPHSGMRM
jgi:hypothetical protein